MILYILISLFAFGILVWTYLGYRAIWNKAGVKPLRFSDMLKAGPLVTLHWILAVIHAFLQSFSK